MPDHYHIITDGKRKISETLRYINGITAKRVIDYLKENNYKTSLDKLRQETKKRNYKHSLWEHHPNAFSINNEKTFMQKVNYIHQNPVRAGLVEKRKIIYIQACGFGIGGVWKMSLWKLMLKKLND